MSTYRLPKIPSLRRHQLLLEFASLKHAPPPGVYVSLTPGDPTLWTGVIFVRSGPYASAILRFQIRFPTSYPDLPPLVTFSTDIFHPLIVPLTTYTFSTGSSNEDPVSATDEERLPPGGFSLRHGFPHWFGRAQRSTATSVSSSRNVSGVVPVAVSGESTGVGSKPSADPSGEDKAQNEASVPSTPKNDGENTEAGPPSVASTTSPNAARASPAPPAEFQKDVPVTALLDYIRSTFDDAKILDELPLEAAGNPGAWHAWRAHRRIAKGPGSESRGSDGAAQDANLKTRSPQARLPGDWNWEGVWEKRVLSGIEASKSDAMLFGNAPRGGSDEMIRFLNMDEASLANVKEMIIPRTEEVHE